MALLFHVEQPDVMENITLKLGLDSEFDALVHGAPDEPPVAKQASDITIVTKDSCTVKGRPGAVISFHVQLPDGQTQRVQAVTTVACLATLLTGLRGRYGPGGPQANRYEDNPFI